MNNSEQGVLYQSKLVSLLIHILLTLFLIQPAYSETTSTDVPSQKKQAPKRHVFVIYSPDNTLHANIIQKLSDNLNNKHPDIIISKVTPEEKIKPANNNINIIISIGSAGKESANKHYPKTNKLFISTDPEKFRLDKKTNKNDAILYMTQSYCRQLQFIKLINNKWKTISLLNSTSKPIDTNRIKQCASRYGIEIFTVSTSTESNRTNDIKNALNHSDALLALPDKSIYNINTVKNILLTSYRYRKPVIAFSKNFVNAGALASIHSNVEQIAQSTAQIIEQYFKLDKHFGRAINYPQLFDISFNRQVFRALDLPLPEDDSLKQTLLQATPDDSEDQQ